MHRYLTAVLLAAPGIAPGFVQEGGSSLLEGHSGHGEVFNDGPRQAAYLMDNPSSVHFPVTVATDELQELFDQGVGQLHGFWYFEAERTFRQIAAEDRDCAMAYWGMAMANVDNPERASGFARVAWLKRGLADERERMYIDAMARFHGAEGPDERDAEEDGETEDDEENEPPLTRAGKEAEREAAEREREDLKDRAARLVKDYEQIVWEYPDDIEAKAFLVNRLWLDRYLGHPITSRQANEALLQEIFAAEPMHPAHHYRIHLWDVDEGAERVVDSAVRSGPSWPGIAHMWHMGGHIFARLGRHTDAAWQQEASARVDHAHMLRDRVLPDQIHNFAHNNEWLTRSLRHHGRVREAVSLARNMIELPRHPIYNTLDRRGCSASWGRVRLLETLELFEQWDELVELAGTMYLEPSADATDGALRAFALGKAHAHLGDDEAFEVQVEALEAMLARSKGERSEALDGAEEAALAAGHELDDARGAMEDVLSEYARELRDVRDKLESLQALRETLAGVDVEANLELLRERSFERAHLARLYLEAGLEAGDDDLTDKAIETARGATEDREGQLYPHATLAFVLHAAGETEEALEVFDELRAWTARADLDLPALRRLAPLAEARGLPPDWRAEETVPEDVGPRVDLATLGPLRWTPPPALDWTCPDAFGREVSLADYRGRPVVVIFFLGFGCVHCVEQLQAFAPACDEYAEAGIELVAICTDGAEQLAEAFGDDPGDTGYPFPVLADPELVHFKRYRSHDDFEDMPLHGTFLVDGRGRVRWQDISYEPFMDWEFLLGESRRLLGLEVGLDDDRSPISSGSSGSSGPAEASSASSGAGG